MTDIIPNGALVRITDIYTTDLASEAHPVWAVIAEYDVEMWVGARPQYAFVHLSGGNEKSDRWCEFEDYPWATGRDWYAYAEFVSTDFDDVPDEVLRAYGKHFVTRCHKD